MDREQQFETYKNQLVEIIKEDPDYWLANEKRRSWELYIEWVDRYKVRLGVLKERLLKEYIPSMDTIIRRVREIRENDALMEKLRQNKERAINQRAEKEKELLRAII